MNRRAMLKVLGGAVAVVTLPIPLPTDNPANQLLIFEERYYDGECAFVVMRAPHDVRIGHLVMWNGQPIGVACDNANRGKRVLVQVYGPARVVAA